MHRKVQKLAVSSKNSDSNPELTDGSRSSSGSESSDGQIAVITRAKGGASNNANREMKGTRSKQATVRRTYSSSTSESSSDDGSFQIDEMKFTSSVASNPESVDSIHIEDYVSSSASSSKSEVDRKPPVPRSFQAYKVTHNQNGMPSTVSPPIQVMDRSGGYDPARIPSSVFERNSTPLEWSVASNESLFSLHLGNVSFNREHAHVFGELGMAEELRKSGHLNPFSQTPLVIIEEIDIARESVDVENPQTNKISVETFKLEGRHIENEVKDSIQGASSQSSKSRMSSISHESGKSFAFPILTEAERHCSAKADFPLQQSYENDSEASGNSTSGCCCSCSKWFHCFSCPSCTCTWKPCCSWKPSCTWKISCTWPKCCRCCCC